MSKTNKNRKIMETYYKSISNGDFDKVTSLMDKNVKFILLANLPFQAAGKGKKMFMEYWFLLLSLALTKIRLSLLKIGKLCVLMMKGLLD